MNRIVAGAAIAASFLASAIASRWALLALPSRFRIDMAQPLPVVTNWNAFGAGMFAILALCLILGAIAYRRAIAISSSETTAHPAWTVAALCALAIACAWWLPVLYSSDAYAYAAYGEMARFGLDPYLPAILPAHEPVFAAAIWQWSNPLPVCVYGPAFVATARGLVASTASWGVVAQLDAMRALSSCALVACGALAYAAYPGNSQRRLAAAATIALNPVAIWCAAEGHNDALALAVVLAGFALSRGPAMLLAGGAVVALSATVKLPGLAAALAFAVADRRVRIGVAIGTATSVLLSIPLLDAALAHVAPHGRYEPQASLQGLIKPLADLVLRADRAATLATLTVAAACALACALRGVQHLRGGNRDGWAWLAIGAWAMVPNPYPWYGVWLAAVAALVPGTRPALILLLLTFASLARYVPDAVGTPPPAASVALAVAASFPYLIAFLPPSRRA